MKWRIKLVRRDLIRYECEVEVEAEDEQDARESAMEVDEWGLDWEAQGSQAERGEVCIHEVSRVEEDK